MIIKKKHYSATRPEPKAEFELLFDRYFKFHNCKTYYPIKNKHSRCDFFLTTGVTTGDCSLVIEYKNRSKSENLSVATFNTSIIEADKLTTNLTLANLIDSLFLYIVEYKEAICCWLIKEDHNLPKGKLLCPLSEGSTEFVLKDVHHLNFKDCELVISKKNYQRATVEQLMKFIYVTRYENDLKNNRIKNEK